MKTFRNTLFTGRDSETTNIVACQAAKAPGSNWVECDEADIDGLTRLYRQGDVVYFGWL